ncbi:ficolin-2-like isoform X2 [Patiria miniata]|uniref:Fibrinogen C-terminal domain-containing protein n=1 Tax=Patiria miniata TaxID=46514 RepID=A0A914B068_PATMI|nr:ficolin-2-like isoform X2 [Patiria miniata]
MMTSFKMRLVLSVCFVSFLCVATATAQAPERRGEGFSDTIGSGVHPETEVHDLEYDQFVYSPHIIINPPRFSTTGVAKACCNCSSIQDIVSTETTRLEAAYRRLRDETREHLKQLQAAMSDLAEMLRNLPDPAVTLPSNPEKLTPATEKTTLPTSSPERSTLPTSTTKITFPSSTPTERVTTPSTTTTRTTEAKTTPSPRTTKPKTTARPEAKTTPKPATTPKTTTQPIPKTTSAPSTSKFTTVTIYKDCSNALARGVTRSGVYKLQPQDNGEEIEVYCDMDTDGGGWTVFQRRQDGSVDFYRDFEGYRQGFGDLEGEFWLGNDNLHRLTAQDDYVLRVDLTDFEDDSKYAVYNSFGVADLSDSYRLSLGQYSGTAGDSLTRHSQKQFTTKDVDNDDFLTGNCALLYHGAWWYERCHQSNLNGNYLGGPTNKYAKGVVWRRWKGYNYSLKTSEMKFRKKN